MIRRRHNLVELLREKSEYKKNLFSVILAAHKKLCVPFIWPTGYMAPLLLLLLCIFAHRHNIENNSDFYHPLLQFIDSKRKCYREIAGDNLEPLLHLIMIVIRSCVQHAVDKHRKLMMIASILVIHSR